MQKIASAVFHVTLPPRTPAVLVRPFVKKDIEVADGVVPIG